MRPYHGDLGDVANLLCHARHIACIRWRVLSTDEAGRIGSAGSASWTSLMKGCPTTQGIMAFDKL